MSWNTTVSALVTSAVEPLAKTLALAETERDVFVIVEVPFAKSCIRRSGWMIRTFALMIEVSHAGAILAIDDIGFGHLIQCC